MKLPLVYPIYNKNKINLDKIESSDVPQLKKINYGMNIYVDNFKVDFDYNKNLLDYNFNNWDDFNIPISQSLLELWEIFCILDLKTEKTINSNLEFIDEFVTEFNKKNKTSLKKSKSESDIYFHKFSELNNIDENIWVNFTVKLISNNIPVKNNGILILQVFDTKTDSSVSLINYLTSLSKESFIIKPSVISHFYDSKFLILKGLKTDIKIKIPKINDDNFIILETIITDDLKQIIQKINSDSNYNKFNESIKIFNIIDDDKSGCLKEIDIINKQHENKNKWIKFFQEKDLLNKLIIKL